MKKFILFLAFSSIVMLTSATHLSYGDGNCCKKGAECKSACCKMVEGKMVCDKKDASCCSKNASCCSKEAKEACKKGEGKSCCHKGANKDETPKK